MTVLPAGTVTFLFCDLEDGTPGLQRSSLSRRRLALDLVCQQIRAHHGHVFFEQVERCYAVFATAPDALVAAIAIQTAAGDDNLTACRIALHTGSAEPQGTTYSGQIVQHTEHVLNAGHNRQILATLATQTLTRDVLPPGVAFRDIGLVRLKALSHPERVYQVIAPTLPDQFPPLKDTVTRRANLPSQTTALIGRDEESRQVRDLLREPTIRLVTLTGAGGVGKTRLGIEAASGVLDDFAHGVFFVPLALIDEAERVLPAIARVVGVPETGQGSLLDVVCEYLRDREVLLVLDNFEQVTDAATMLNDLLEAAPHLKLLITSRAVLRLSGEHDFPVSPLAVPPDVVRGLPGWTVPAAGSQEAHPDGESSGTTGTLEHLAQFGAVALFTARAQAAKADFTLTNDNVATVVAICARLDGLPLALELAAARIRLLSPQELLPRLDRRLAILTGGARNLLPHQKTLRSTIDWSYDLLAPPEQVLFARLAVFAGGCSIASAEAVCDDADDGSQATSGMDRAAPLNVLDSLQILIDESLLRQIVPHRATGETRLFMLETIREYALERLQQSGELERVRRQHANYYSALVEQAEPGLAAKDAEQTVWLERLDVESDNLRAALAWSRTQPDNGALLLRLAGSLWRYWEIRGRFTEGREWLEAALQRASQDRPLAPSGVHNGVSPEIARVLDGAGILADYQGDYGRAEELYQQSLLQWQELGDERGVARALNGLGGIAAVRGDALHARRYYEQSLVLRQSHRDQSGEATTLNNLALVAFEQDDYSGAQSYFEASLQIAREIGDQRAIARGLANVGLAAMYREDYERAEQLLEASLMMYRSFGEPSGIAHILGNLGNLALAREDFGRAGSFYSESLDLFYDLEDRNGLAESLEGLAREAAGRRGFERAVRLWAAADALRLMIDAPLPAAERDSHERSMAIVRDELTDLRFAAAWEVGRAMPLAHVVLFARDRSSLHDAPESVVEAPPTEDVSQENVALPAGLSEREAEVLRLIARGLTTRQVADTLIISPRTVHAHLASIYSKIGVSTRVAATHFALDHGLV